MIVKLTRWTGETREIETASVALALVHEYPDFATSDQNENGWICWDEPNERYGASPKVAVYNVYGDWCATIEETRGAGIITPTPQNESTAIEKILNDDEERSWMCEGHARKLDKAIRGIEQRYPEVNHPEYCGCYGCTGDVYTDPFEAE